VLRAAPFVQGRASISINLHAVLGEAFPTGPLLVDGGSLTRHAHSHEAVGDATRRGATG
jgi:hypothetical protein